MIRIVNVSNKIIVIGNISVKPMQTIIFDYDNADIYTQNRINSLANLGLIKIYPYYAFAEEGNNETVEIIDETETPKKSNKKSK